MTYKMTYDSQTPFFYGFYESCHLNETDLERDLEGIHYYKMDSLEVKDFINNNKGLWNKFVAENKAKGKRNYKKEFINSWARDNDPCLFEGYSIEEAKNRVAKKYSDFVFSHLDLPSLGISEIHSTGVWSPSYYNFITDTADVRIVFSDIELFKSQIRKAISENRELFEFWIGSRHTSYDGCTSYYSNDPKGWENFECAKGDLKGLDNVTLHTYLGFLLLVELRENHNTYSSDDSFSELDFNKLVREAGCYFNYSLLDI